MSLTQASGTPTSARIDDALKRATETKLFWLGDDMIQRVPEMFKTLFPGMKACVVADRNTLGVAGREVHAALVSAGVETVRPYVFDQPPHAGFAAMAQVRDYIREQDAVAVAVGSGSINDICKLASYEVGRSYLCVATAASVDGYASSGAPMTIDGFKKTVPCRAPSGIIADIGVLVRAPYEMTAAGYGDLMAKVTAGADWIIADAVGAGGEPIHPVAWSMVQDPLAGWLQHPHELKHGGISAFSDLFEGLTISGFAMQAAHSSRPASGCEHMFAHVWDMSGIKAPDGIEASHGFKVSVGTLVALAAMECVFSREFTSKDIDEAMTRYPAWEERERMIRALFGNETLGDKTVGESRAKHLTREALADRLRMIAGLFGEMQSRVEGQVMTFMRMREMLRCAGCPVRPEAIGIKPTRCAASVVAAQMIRSRYTVLDLAYETGRFYDVVKRVGEVWDECEPLPGVFDEGNAT